MFKNIFVVMFIFLCSVSVSAADFTVNKLPNGQTLIVQEVKNNPIVTIDTWVRTGSINETDANSGISHFLEHLFFKGTKLHPAGDFDRILESKGAIVNAATSKDFTHYFITLPSQYFNTAIELHADMLTNPQIPRKELEKERKVVLEEIAKDANNPTVKVYNNMNELLYTNHPYKRRVIGSADVISTIRREEILDYFNNFYTPSNMVTIIIGDVNNEAVVKKVSEVFGTEYKKFKKPCRTKEPALTSQKNKTEYTDVQTGYMMVGFRGVPISKKETYALDLLSKILGEEKNSRLYKSLKEQKGLVYSVSAGNMSLKEDGVFYINTNYNPANTQKVEKAIFDEILMIQKYGITDEELNTAKKIMEQETYYSRESVSNIATELGYTVLLTENTDFYTNYINNINKVTTADIKYAAQKFLGKNKSAISCLLPKSMENSVQPAQKKHNAKKVSESNGITKYIIDNNSTLLINENSNNNIIAIDILAKGGEFSENIIGEGTLTAATLLKGTKKYSSQELAKIMEENGIKITPSCNEDTFELKIKTTISALDITLDVLNEIINNSVFDEYELEKQRTELIGKIKQKRDIPMNIAIENFKSLIFENSVYSHTNKIIEKNLPNITRSDILKYYKRIFDSKNIIISVNGNIQTDKLIQAFGNILPESNSPAFSYSNHKIARLNNPKTVSSNIKNAQTAWLFWGWQTAGFNNKKDFVTLKVLNTMLGSGMSSRLFRNLREQDGLAYQIGSNYKPFELGGYFLTYIGTNPETLNYSKEKIKKEIERLKKEFVSDSELEDAKSRLQGSFIVALETNSEKASTVCKFEAMGLGYEFMPEYLKMINEVTASDILSVANKYFNNIYVESVVK